jgi:hypothetical protein
VNKWDLLGMLTTVETGTPAWIKSMIEAGLSAANLAAQLGISVTAAQALIDKAKEEAAKKKRCNELRQAVKKSKQALGGMGKCLCSDSPEVLRIKMTAWCDLSTNRWRQLQECYKPGDPGYDGHKERQWLDYDKCVECKKLLGIQ